MQIDKDSIIIGFESMLIFLFFSEQFKYYP